MKTKLFLLVLILGTFSNLFAKEGEFTWHYSYSDALEESKKTGKPILLTFR